MTAKTYWILPLLFMASYGWAADPVYVPKKSQSGYQLPVEKAPPSTANGQNSENTAKGGLQFSMACTGKDGITYDSSHPYYAKCLEEPSFDPDRNSPNGPKTVGRMLMLRW